MYSHKYLTSSKKLTDLHWSSIFFFLYLISSQYLHPQRNHAVNVWIFTCKCLDKSPNRRFTSSGGVEAGLFLPDALCLKKKVLTDSWAPRLYSARVQCGCLANEADYRDYNQAGNIRVLMCQSGWENLPVLLDQRKIFSFVFTVQVDSNLRQIM